MIPGDKEWNGGFGCLDGQYAYKNFNGVPYDKAVQMFNDASSLYQEDLRYMPSKVCEFYFRAFADYIVSLESQDDYEGAMCFIYAFISLEKDIVGFAPEVRDFLNEAAKHIYDNEEKFGEDGVIDQGMRKRLGKMKHISFA